MVYFLFKIGSEFYLIMKCNKVHYFADQLFIVKNSLWVLFKSELYINKLFGLWIICLFKTEGEFRLILNSGLINKRLIGNFFIENRK